MDTARVLLVDDSRTIRAFLGSALREFGFDVLDFADPTEAFASMKEFKPDCILTDFEMPGMTGLELIQKIRAGEEFKNIPIVVISSLDQDEKIVDCINAGAEDYILKRTNPEVLVSKVKILTELKQSRDNRILLERLRTFKATIVTLNHELNNLSSILIPLLSNSDGSEYALKEIKEDSQILLRNLHRLVDTVNSLQQMDKVEFEKYVKNTEMLTLEKKSG